MLLNCYATLRPRKTRTLHGFVLLFHFVPPCQVETQLPLFWALHQKVRTSTTSPPPCHFQPPRPHPPPFRHHPRLLVATSTQSPNTPPPPPQTTAKIMTGPSEATLAALGTLAKGEVKAVVEWPFELAGRPNLTTYSSACQCIGVCTRPWKVVVPPTTAPTNNPSPAPATAAPTVSSGFVFGGCSGGSGSFTKDMPVAGSYATIGEIPVDQEGLSITLISTKDLDVQIWCD